MAVIRYSCAAVLAYAGAIAQLASGGGSSWDHSARALKLGLTHRDFAGSLHESPTPSASQRLARAVLRSSRRAAFLNQAACGGFRTAVHAEPGAFVTTASLGSPPVPFTAVVDTGSDLVWRQCTPCTSCFPQPDPVFNPSSSSTYHRVSCHDPLCTSLADTLCPTRPSHVSSPCTYLYSYGDFSFTSGDLSFDTLTLPDSVSGLPTSFPRFAFGCGHNNAFSNFAGASGLIGLGQGPLSLPSQLGIPSFSYCLQTITDPASNTSALILGRGASFDDAPSTISTPLLTNSFEPTLYYIGLTGISVGGKPLNIPSGTFDLLSDGSGGMIIDSGTTLTSLVITAYSKVVDAFNKSILLAPVDGARVGLELCYDRHITVPSLTFHFDGGILTLPMDNYFIKVDGLFCLAMAASSDISIYGNIQQQNYHILYNRLEKTLSFTPATCDSL